MSFWDSASARGSVEEGLVGGDESWPHLQWEDDGGGETWGSKNSRPSFEVDRSQELAECGEPAIEVNMADHEEVGDETDDPAVDQVSNEVGILSLFDEHLSFIYLN